MKSFAIVAIAWVLTSAQARPQTSASQTSAPPTPSADPVEIVRKSVEHDLINFERLKNYTYLERDEARAYDIHGKLKKTEIATYEILILAGRDYARQIERDDRPLPEKDARKEAERMDKELAKRERESAEDKARQEKERQEERRFLNEVPEAFVFRLVGDESVSGKPAWVIDAEPRPGYQPKDRRAKIITKLRGRIWIDKGEYQWVKVDAQAIDTVSFGFRMLQIEPGATVRFEQTRINDEVWLPASARIYADARLVFLKRLHSEVDIQFSNYQKFQADSHLVAGDNR
jgi:hypothetical protein